jgi:hypothetical protein
MDSISLRSVSLLLGIVLVTGVVCGAGGMYVLGPQREITHTWLYQSRNISIAPDGTAVIGKNYDRDTEAVLLLEAFKDLQINLIEPTCRQADYKPVTDDMRWLRGYGMAIPFRWLYRKSGADL